MQRDEKLEALYENITVTESHCETDEEGGMLANQIETIITAANKIKTLITNPNAQLPAWVQGKMSLAEDYIVTVSNYIDSAMKTNDPEVSNATKQIKSIRVITPEEFHSNME